ncbi:hypothetical protein IFM89_023270 [Coptis chinensis]|uniref:Uncharacterized protein n=1 Tax=Coptis chinensis TaxID=261450 RepID=A0A835LWX3_9MAGN|nr:hypothetical protein IFM89_023270 [Coptis chinensis]
MPSSRKLKSFAIAIFWQSIKKFDMLLMEIPHHLGNSSLMHGAATLVEWLWINVSHIFDPGSLLDTDKRGVDCLTVRHFGLSPSLDVGKLSQEAGAPPSLGDLFVRTHTSSQTHDTLDDQSREYINTKHKMKDLAGIDEHGTQLPLSDEIYREVMPPERHGCVRLKGRGVTPTSYFGSRLSSDNRVNDLESQLAEMQRVAQEKEEERRLEIEEIKRQT